MTQITITYGTLELLEETGHFELSDMYAKWCKHDAGTPAEWAQAFNELKNYVTKPEFKVADKNFESELELAMAIRRGDFEAVKQEFLTLKSVVG